MILKTASIAIYLTFVGAVVFNGTTKYNKNDSERTTYYQSPALFDKSADKSVPESARENSFNNEIAVEKINLIQEETPSFEHMESIVMLEKYKLEKKIDVALFPTYRENNDEENKQNQNNNDEPVEFIFDEVATTSHAAPSLLVTQEVSTAPKKGLSLAEADKAIEEINQKFINSSPNSESLSVSIVPQTANQTPIGKVSIVKPTSVSNQMNQSSLPLVASSDDKNKEKKENIEFNKFKSSALAKSSTPDEASSYMDKISEADSSTEINFFPLQQLPSKSLDKLRFKLDVVALGNADTRIHSNDQFHFEALWESASSASLSSSTSQESPYFAAIVDKYFASTRFSVNQNDDIKEVPLLSLDLFQSLDPSFVKGETSAALIRIDQVPETNIPFVSLDGKTQIGNLLYLDNNGNVVEGNSATYVLIYRLPAGNVFVGQEDENKNTAMKVVHLLPSEVYYVDRITQNNFSQVVTFHIEHLMGKISQEFNLNLDSLGGEFQNFQFRKINYNTIEISSPLVWKDDSQYLALKQDETMITIAIDRNSKTVEVPSAEYVEKIYKDLGLEKNRHCVLQLNFSDEKINIDQLSSSIITKEIKGQSADTSLEELETIVLDESGVYMKDEWVSPRKIFTYSEGTGEILLRLSLRSGVTKMINAPCAPGTYVVKTISL